jgi:prophage DNA circulation protein
LAPKPQGKFREASFYVLSHDTTFGRRSASSALPFQDRGVASFDLGRSPREFSMSVCVLGNDYRTARDALIEALEAPGPGILVHPEHGRVSVIVESKIKISESTATQQMATIAFRATETFDQPPGVASLDTASVLKSAVKGGRLAAATSFENPITGLKAAVGDFVAAAHLDVLDNVLNDMRAVNGAISSVLSIPGGFAAQIDAISRQASDLLQTPRRLFDSIDGAFELIAAAARRVFGPNGADIDADDIAVVATSLPLRRGTTLFRAVEPTAELGSDSPPVPDIDTEERRDQAAGQLAMQRHFRASGLMNLANTAADVPLDSAVDALALRDVLVDSLITLAESEPDMDADLVAALKNVAATAHSHLTAVAGRLPSIVTYTPQDTLPIEVIAWQLYADPERADEILLRNPQIDHPGLVPGKLPLEVART